jgi:hypothetical protein
VRTLRKEKERVETGALRFGDDWPGLFIRGDDCLIVKMLLEKHRYNQPVDFFDVLSLNKFIELINEVIS